jgi:hypothetical protein
MHHEGGAQTQTLNLLKGSPTAASPDAHSCYDCIGPHWDIYTRQVRLARKGWQRARVVQGSRYHRYYIDY